VVNGALNFAFAARDLGFEQFDPLAQLVDREGIEILLAQLGG